MTKRLFVQVYLTFLGIVVLFGLLASIAWWLAREERPDRDLYQGLGAILMQVLPPAGAPRAEIDAALDRLGRSLDSRITVRSPDGAMLGHAGRPLPRPKPDDELGGWQPGRGPGRPVVTAATRACPAASGGPPGRGRPRWPRRGAAGGRRRR